VRDRDRVARRLATVIGTDPAELRAKLRPNRSFVWIQRWVTPEQAERVRKLDLEGVHLHTERKRFYPSRTLAASYLGFAGRDDVGLSGVELSFDSQLRGAGSNLRALRDARGRKLIDVAAQPQGRSGATVVLAIDARLQHFTESALARALARTGAQQGVVVALDPRRGDVLAIAQAPGFDPNSFWLAKPDAWRARAFVDGFEPGSTLKPFTVAVAIEAGRVRPDDRFDCENGSWQVLDRRIRDWQPHGVLSVHDIVRLSSNIGAAKVADRVGSRDLVEGLRGFGFGTSTGSGFPGEAAGIVHPLRETQAVERANLAFGQGLTVTALQLAAAGAILANGGERVRPRLALAYERDGQRLDLPSERGERVISRSTARTVLGMMRDVVATGTGHGAALPRHAAAGKTGTAQKVVNGRYSDDRFIASFLGIVPVANPRLVIVVVLDEPRRGTHTGGAAAAPVFREVAGFAVEQLGLPPEGST
jgi:cell division protein FtsI (penicillin-binding protein 3)